MIMRRYQLKLRMTSVKKRKIFQEQAQLIEEKEKEGRKILAATENLKESGRSQADMAKKLKETEAASSRAMKKLSEKQGLIQDQAQLIKEKEKESSTDGPSSKDK